MSIVNLEKILDIIIIQNGDCDHPSIDGQSCVVCIHYNTCRQYSSGGIPINEYLNILKENSIKWMYENIGKNATHEKYIKLLL